MARHDERERRDDIEEAEAQRSARQNRTRALGGVVLLAVVVAFVVDNSQTAAVHFWFFTGHPRLVYLMALCLVAGAVLGLWGARLWRRRKIRRAERRRR
ncbi:MAG: LapA family protein [Acidimicrobiales bacterium]